MGAAVTAKADPVDTSGFAEIPHTQPEASPQERLLALHNSERQSLGLPALTWNSQLARDAQGWASQLLKRGALQHATPSDRKGHGENLWMGTAGAWDVAGMVEMFLEERRYFREAAFPDVSLTGNWTDVGHYSQIIWRETREVGCAIDSGNGMDVLVCRYYPAGNVFGRTPY
ncbi:CAP domain-containing protein [Qipengyuania sp.]|uniref:CAP domain-containing protein n=1 Tax=Qipengyuania sp. TaxID=2004515 RepID=UPI0035C7C5C2